MHKALLDCGAAFKARPPQAPPPPPPPLADAANANAADAPNALARCLGALKVTREAEAGGKQTARPASGAKAATTTTAAAAAAEAEAARRAVAQAVSAGALPG